MEGKAGVSGRSRISIGPPSNIPRSLVRSRSNHRQVIAVGHHSLENRL
jgi:hypothetical protein